ncbi:tRNA uridine-5-carboxymethylaminomethyl(34) synthesis enzyme MnmG, partial [candidate division WOR-3 bacterium]|nr:tRNA uridine-5-carboxymethylaminomethyl(34) synthesis enzyme MnmG [candidate division WOR-3 bacterium]
MGCRTLLLTQSLDSIGSTSCNPAIGGVGKGQLVRELDALGGTMARIADSSLIHYRQLNSSKGRALRSTRVQVDRQLYRTLMKAEVERCPGLSLAQGTATRIVYRGRTCSGIETDLGEKLRARTVVLAPGTFLDGLVHIGLTSFPAGRLGEAPARDLGRSLKELGFRLGRFKTGTPPRLDLRTIDLDRLEPQPGDEPVRPFSAWTETRPANRVKCYVTYTNPKTHRVVRSGLDRSPLYTGVIKGRGVRYCPSIEDKVVRFAEQERHHVFIEPEGLGTIECYPNGISTSLPIPLQLKLLHSIAGLEQCRMMRPGYAIEHDYSDPTRLHPTLETRLVKNLYFAGQLNGTTGYEEAAAQGLVAGINAALRAQAREPLVLSRADSYIGVMIDDLTTQGTDEPYRMFTARVEFRLLLREDNADLRLAAHGRRLGLLSPAQLDRVKEKETAINRALDWLRKGRIRPGPRVNRLLRRLGTTPLRESVPPIELLRRPEVTWDSLREMAELAPDRTVADVVELEVKYEGYVARTRRQLAEFARLESVRIPARLDYSKVSGLSNEVREKLSRIRPGTLSQAQQIPGMTPAALFALLVFLKGRGT